MYVQAAVATDLPVVVAVDVGKKVVALSVTDTGRHRLLGPVGFEMTGGAWTESLPRSEERWPGRVVR